MVEELSMIDLMFNVEQVIEKICLWYVNYGEETVNCVIYDHLSIVLHG